MIGGKIQNMEAPDRMAKKVLSINQSVQGRAVQFSLLLQQNIRSNLSQVLGDKMKHFDVTLSQGGYVTVISVHPKTKVGQFLWTGTRPRRIRSMSPMPIGDGRYAYSVNHPGTEGKERQIEEAISRALTETSAALSGFPRVLP